MKSWMIFFGIIFSIHFLVNYYIYSRGIAGLEGWPQYRTAFRVWMLVMLLAYPLGRFLEKVWYSPVTVGLHWTGAFWFAAMLYLVLILVGFDLIRLANTVLGFLPPRHTPEYIQLKKWAVIGTSATVLLIVVAGHLNAWIPKINRSAIQVHKSAGAVKSLKIVAVSDIHLGSIIGPRKTASLVEKVNALNPDVILLAGDVVDEDIDPVIRQNLGESLRQLRAPLGVYAIAGNHEYIGGVDRALDYLRNHGLTILRDSVVTLPGNIHIVGRDDRESLRHGHSGRKSLKALLEGLPASEPVVVLNHQPYDLNEAVEAGADIHISGHTHHGQLWPWGYLTGRIFELSRGYLQKGTTHFFVSTGFGTWGPPVRTGNRPEILDIVVTFEK